MTTLTITLTDDRLAKLREIADRFNITPEDLPPCDYNVSLEETNEEPHC